MPSIPLNCSDCNSEFFFTERDQDFFAQQGWGPPRRCKPCRDARKAARTAEPRHVDPPPSGPPNPYFPDPVENSRWTRGDNYPAPARTSRRESGRRRNRDW